MVVVLTGNNDFLIKQEIAKLVKDFSSKFGDSIERFDGSESNISDGVLDAVRSLSFLEPRKLVMVRDFSQSKDLLEKIQDVVEQTADSTDLLLVDGKLDKRTSAYKFLQKNTDIQVLGDLNPYELEKWLTSKAVELGTKISISDAKFLIERAGNNQQLLANEIQKMALMSSEIDRKVIEEMVEPTPQSQVFSMLDELFQGRSKKAWELYIDQRAQGEEPQKIIGMITWQLQQLTMAVFAPVKTKDALVRAGVSPYTAQKSLSQASNISKENLKYYINQLGKIDALSKTSADIESALAVYFSDVSVRQNSI